MATERDVVQNQMLLNSCVQLIPVTNAVLIVTHPLLQPRPLDIAKRRTWVRQSLPLCGDVAQELSMNSAQIAESHGRLPEQRIEVVGSCLNPNSLMPR